MIYPQPHDSARNSGLLAGAVVVNKSGSAGATNAQPSLTETTPSKEVLMAPEADTAHGADAQRFIDPLILHARFVNEAAALDRALAMRKALRPARSEAARKGWRSRNG